VACCRLQNDMPGKPAISMCMACDKPSQPPCWNKPAAYLLSFSEGSSYVDPLEITK